jgi:hypothetical protein
LEVKPRQVDAVDDRGTLLVQWGAYGVEEDPAGSNEQSSMPENAPLNFTHAGPVFGTATQQNFRPTAQGAKTGAGSVDEHAIKLASHGTLAHRPIHAGGFEPGGIQPQPRELSGDLLEPVLV